MDSQEGSTTEALIAAVVPHAGEEGMRKLMLLFGGGVIQVPRYPTPKSPLVRALGLDIATKIHRDLLVTNADGKAVGRQRFYVPNRARDNLAEKVSNLLIAGKSVDAIRVDTGVSVRTIRKYRAILIRKGLIEAHSARPADEVQP